MPITGTKIMPEGAEMVKGYAGRLTEVWRLTGDGSATTYALTAQSGRYIESIIGMGFTHNVSAATPSLSATLTFATAPGNTLTFDVQVNTRE